MTGIALSQTQRRFVDGEFLKLGAFQNTRVLLGVMMATALLALLVGRRAGPGPAILWFVVVGVVQAVRVRVESQLGREQLGRELLGPLTRRLRHRVLIAGICGVAQGLCLLSFPLLNGTERAFVSLVLLGLATGSVANSAGYVRCVAAYTGPMLVPLVILWAVLPGELQTPWFGPVLALLIMLYSGVLAGFATTAWATFEESCVLRFRDQERNLLLQEALGQAETANRAKTRFLAAASHDLRQPLHTISLLSAALGLRQLDDRSLEIVKLLNEVTAALTAQLDDLLDISKLDAGVVDVSVRTISAAGVLAEHFSEVEAVVRDKGLEPVLRVSTDSHFRTDPQLLARILRNLTHNAVKFTERGSVTLEARDEGERVVLSVRDTGCGIAPHHQAEVFMEFFQVGNVERDRSKGLGLGLSIVKRLADLMGIGLELRSVQGQGTEFVLYLPRAPAQPQTAAAKPGRGGEEAFDIDILLVDDERSVRTGMRMLLEELGCRCREAAGTAEARRSALDQAPDLVLADFRLRNEDSGLLAIAAVREVAGDVAAVLVSGDTAPDRLQEAGAAGVRMLHKPLSLNEIRNELRAARKHKSDTKRRETDERHSETVDQSGGGPRQPLAR